MGTPHQSAPIEQAAAEPSCGEPMDAAMSDSVYASAGASDKRERPTRVVVIGCSGHGKVILDVLVRSSAVTIAGFIDTYKKTGSFCEFPVLGTEEDLVRLFDSGSVDAGIIGIGDNWSRRVLAEKLVRLCPQMSFPRVIHSSAQIARDARVGDGTVVLAGAIINSGADVGDFCILNTGASLDHDSSMRDYSSLAPAVATGGGVHIGLCSAICIGAIISNDIRIGNFTVIGAGATVLKDIPDEVVAFGTPAHVVRTRVREEPYLVHASE